MRVVWPFSLLNTFCNGSVEEITALAASPRRSKIDPSFWFSANELMAMEIFGREPGTLVPLRLSPMFRVETTSVYQLVDESELDVVLVYRQYCYRPSRPLNMMVTDYWFLSHLQSSGLVPKVYDISDPFLPPPMIVAGAIGKTPLRRCANPGISPEVRYIVMDRIVGDSVEDFAVNFGDTRRRVSVARAAELGIRMIQTVRKLHELGIVHGDAHSGNFLFEQVQSGDDLVGELRMIDFERAKFFNAEEDNSCDSPEYVTSFPLNKYQPSVWNSIWEGRGCPRSFRDDIHRIYVAIAFLIHGPEYFNFLSKLANGHRDSFAVTKGFWKIWHALRTEFRIFHLTGFPRFMAAMRFEQLHMTGKNEFRLDDVAKSEFNKLEMNLRAMTITAVPDYDFIVGILEGIRVRARGDLDA
jgi:serine/threonine protein kinase